MVGIRATQKEESIMDLPVRTSEKGTKCRCVCGCVCVGGGGGVGGEGGVEVGGEYKILRTFSLL